MAEKNEKKAAKETKEAKEAKAAKEDNVKAENASSDEAALHPTLQKKKERREAKAARKAANMAEDKKSRPNNILLAVLIFGVLIAMFAFVGGYNYFQMPADIEKYIEDTGGEEVYGSVMVDAYTTAKVTATGNSLNIDMTAETDDEEVIEDIKEFYGGDDGKDQLQDIASSFLLNMKPNVRGFGADAKIKMSLNGEEINSAEITYSEAKKKQKEAQKEAKAAADSDGLVVNTDNLELDEGDAESEGGE